MTVVFFTKCNECGRLFDLFNNITDADEWYNGHDCESWSVRMVENDPLTVKMTILGVIFVIYAQINPQTLYTPYPIHAII